MNKILVIGNVGSDPEMRYTPNGTAVTSFSLATNRVYTTASGERREETEWFTVNAWGREAENSNQNFMNLNEIEQSHIVEYLKTFQIQEVK